ncbi:MAG TPA: type IX secretion system membrane protein PorP/SprF, partial [Bacteroidota bacterium]
MMANPKLRTVIIIVFLVLLAQSAVAQHVSSARGIGIGAYSALANDLSALDWNPAGIALVRDWEFSTASHLWVGPASNAGGIAFQGAGITKRFMQQHSVAMRYAPAVSMEFTVPSIFKLNGSQEVTFDQRILYDERYALGYALRSSETVSFGVSARYLQEHVIDTEPFILQDTVARIRTVDYNSDSWNVDFGFLWEPERQWKLGVVAKNLFKIRESEFPQDIRSFALRTTKSLRAGVAYAPSKPLWLAFDFDTEKQGALGFEWDMGENISFRQGTYFGKSYGPFVKAISTGLGWSTETARFDLSYMFVTHNVNRTRVLFDDFVSQGVRNIGFNQYTPSQLTFSMNVVLGRTRETLARIEHVEILDEVYPSSYYRYAYQPLGRAIVRNISASAIQARVGFYSERFMDSPTMTEQFYVAPQSTRVVEFKAVFNDAIKSVSTMILQAGDVFVSAAQATDFDDKVQTSLIIRGRNDWDGNVLSLKAFVTPNDPDLLRFSRKVLADSKDSLGASAKELEHFQSATLLFNEFASRMVYVNDPQSSKDRVQYPSETLSLRGGDCDDMTVFVSSMLASVGIATA